MDFIDLKTQQGLIRKKIFAAVKKVFDHGQYIMGPEVFELEETLAEYVGVSHAISCSSGTDALLISCMAKGIRGTEDVVITTPFSFIATAEIILLLGARPVFVDIDPYTYNIDPSEVQRAISFYQGRWPGSVKAVIAVDIFGQPADYRRLENICAQEGVFLIEDAAQSFGAEFLNRKAGSFGNVGCTSFFPSKPLGGYGDGGMIFTNDDDLAERMRSIRNHGAGKDRYDNVRLGVNGRLDTIQAAILLQKFRLFPEELESRQKVAEQYQDLLSGISELTLPYVDGRGKSAWAQYSILADSSLTRHYIMETLTRAGIPIQIYYPKPICAQPSFREIGFNKFHCPISYEVCDRIFSLPFHPYLTLEEQKKIAANLFRVYNRLKENK